MTRAEFRHSRSPLWWEAHSSQQLLITPVGAKGVESLVHIYMMERNTFLLRSFQPCDGLVIFVEPGINQRSVIRRDVAMFGLLLQFTENLTCFSFVPRCSIGVAEVA